MRPSLERVLAEAAVGALHRCSSAPHDRYPGLMLGTPHGSAVHLAVALGVPWLPLDGGWREVVERCVAARGPVLLIHGPCEIDRDILADLHTVCDRQHRAVREVLYRDPDALSAAVGDLYRDWLRQHGRSGNQLVVECGRLIEPWHVLRAGLVPYWCREATWEAVQELGWWLAGSEPFTSIDALPEPPGAHRPATAPLDSWQAVAAFATECGEVDRRCARRYPTGHVTRRHAAKVLARRPNSLPYPPLLELADALHRLAGPNAAPGVLVR